MADRALQLLADQPAGGVRVRPAFGAARAADLPARVLMSLLFLASGFGKLAAAGATGQYMAAFGVPPALLWPAAAVEIAGGVLLVLGLWLRPLGLVLAAWCVLTAAIFHTAFSDQMQLVMFLKNMAMAGGFLLLARSGAPFLGLDGRRPGHVAPE